MVIFGKPSFWMGRGSLSLRGQQIKQVGEGDLLQRIEKYRSELRASGAFDSKHKKPLPVLPKMIGLITGRDSAAERDVLEVSRRRWPNVQFRVMHSPVQGPATEGEIFRILGLLDADPEVDVIIIARGGGSVEDLLPFSSPRIVQAVFNCRTPVISAIGHEPDNPILDDVADFRAATPTDAAKSLVLDSLEESAQILMMLDDVERAIEDRIRGEEVSLLQDGEVIGTLAGNIVYQEGAQILELVDSAIRSTLNVAEREAFALEALSGQIDSLDPSRVASRGFSIVRHMGNPGRIVMSSRGVEVGNRLRIQLPDGSEIAAEVAFKQ